MKTVIRFSRGFLPAAILSILIMISGVVGFIVFGGINLGVDFQAGLLQEIQFAPQASRLTYNGPGTASIYLSRTSLDIVVSGAGIDEITHRFAFASYPTLSDLGRGLRGVEGLAVLDVASPATHSSWLVQSAQSSPVLEANIPFVLHYLTPDAKPIPIEEVRSSLLPLGSVSVQVLGTPAERRFLIRMEDSEINNERGVPAEKIISILENSFGEGEVSVTRSDYVDSRFSKNLKDQIGLLVGLTLLLILVYLSFRFKIHYAIGSVVGIVNDAIVMMTFIILSRMEFNTSTIAALLTIFGYSINNTIVVFDRVRENNKLFPDDPFVDVLNRSITGTLSRTLITTLTTILAVLSLYIFTSGSMKDFALALLVGLTSGVYTTIFIASGIVYSWDNRKTKKEKRRLTSAPSSSKA